MRFGIMGMQIQALVPSGLPPERIPAHVANFDYAGLVRRLAGQGFDTIELGGDMVLFFPNVFSPEGIARLKAVKDELGLHYTLHLPLWSVEPSTPLTPVREGSARAVIDALRATTPLEPEVCVLHATGALAAEFYRMYLPEPAHTLLLRQFQGQARASIETILRETGLPRRRLAIETIEFPFELTLELAAALDISLCLDTGHVLVGFSGPVDLFDVLDRCLPRLAEIHLHDGPWQGPEQHIGYGKDHQPLGAGDLDVGRLLDRLSAAGFAGPLIFELRVDQALASLERIRELRPNSLR